MSDEENDKDNDKSNIVLVLLLSSMFWLAGLLVLSVAFSGCAGGPLSTREKGLLGGVGVGAAAGGIIGAVTGHPGAGAAIGGALGLGAGVLIGDQLQKQEKQNEQLQKDLERFYKCVEEGKLEYERTGRNPHYVLKCNDLVR